MSWVLVLAHEELGWAGLGWAKPISIELGGLLRSPIPIGRVPLLLRLRLRLRLRLGMASMFPQLGATAESFSKASSLVLRIGTDAHLYDDPDDASIAPLLDSRFDSDKSEALKRLLALIAQGADVSHFFPQVSFIPHLLRSPLHLLISISVSVYRS